MRGKYLAVGILVLASLISPVADADTLDVPAQYSTISAALNAANSGDAIKIAPGHYYEYGLVLPAGVTLSGEGSSAEDTVIDAQGQGRILTAKYLETVSFVQNLTFQNGWAKVMEGYDHCGGALYINGSMLRVFNCRFIGNQAEADGGAISIMRASPLIINCQFEDNRAGEGGGALDCSYDASPIIQNSTFRGNTAAYGGATACRGNSNPNFSVCQFDRNITEGELSHGGAVLSFFWGNPSFSGCTFSRNSADVGGAIFSDIESPTHLTSCTVVGNSGLIEGAGIFTRDSQPEIKTSIIAFQEGVGVLCTGRTIPLIACSNIYGNTGGNWDGDLAPMADIDGNLSVDPLFCENDLDVDYMFNIQDDSPCSIAGGACDDMGAWPVGCDTPMDTLITLDMFTVIWVDGIPTITWLVDGQGGNRGAPVFRLARSSQEFPDQEHDIEYRIGPDGEFIAQDLGFLIGGNENYFYRLYLLLDGGTEYHLGTVHLIYAVPKPKIQDAGAHPNPFNPQTRIHFKLNSSQKVRAEIYGIDGRRVRTLADRTFPSGPQNLVWDGRDNNGRTLASGTFVVVLTGEDNIERLKVTLLK